MYSIQARTWIRIVTVDDVLSNCIENGPDKNDDMHALANNN